jgi:hypothetical protein
MTDFRALCEELVDNLHRCQCWYIEDNGYGLPDLAALLRRAHAALAEQPVESTLMERALAEDAAVLRTVADQVVPEELLKGSDPDAWLRSEIRQQLLAIADELEAPTLMERAVAGDTTAAKQFLHQAGFTDKHGQWLPQYQPIPETTNE